MRLSRSRCHIVVAQDRTEFQKVLNSVIKGTFPLKTKKKTGHISDSTFLDKGTQ